MHAMTKKCKVDFDASGRSGGTIDADLSDRTWIDDTARSARVVGDRSGLEGRHLKGCLKVKTQYESLARIPLLRLRLEPSVDRTVRFSTVEVRQYGRVLSNNPSTSCGPPIGIDWTYDPDETLLVDLDIYEREQECRRRRNRELIIPALGELLEDCV